MLFCFSFPQQCHGVRRCRWACGTSAVSHCFSSLWFCRVSTRAPLPIHQWCSGGTSHTAVIAHATPSAFQILWGSRHQNWGPPLIWIAATTAAPFGLWPLDRDLLSPLLITTKTETSPLLTVIWCYFLYYIHLFLLYFFLISVTISSIKQAFFCLCQQAFIITLFYYFHYYYYCSIYKVGVSQQINENASDKKQSFGF